MTRSYCVPMTATTVVTISKTHVCARRAGKLLFNSWSGAAVRVTNVSRMASLFQMNVSDSLSEPLPVRQKKPKRLELLEQEGHEEDAVRYYDPYFVRPGEKGWRTLAELRSSPDFGARVLK